MEDNETKRFNKEVLNSLKQGDVIRFFAGYREHWAVYFGEDEKAGDASIIHWWSENDASSHWFNWQKKNYVASNPRIMIDSFWKFADKLNAEKENSDLIQAETFLEQAKAFKQKLEEEEKEKKTYPNLFDNCEHFAKWCHYGLGFTGIKKDDISRVKNVMKFVHGIFTNHTFDSKAIRCNVGVLNQLKPGDVVRFSRGSYEHWATYIGQRKAVYISLESDISQGIPIIVQYCTHWWDQDGTTEPYTSLVSFWELAGNCTAEKINTDELRKYALTEGEAFDVWFFEPSAMPAFDFHCSEDYAKFCYLQLMCKTKKETKRDFSSIDEKPVCFRFCKHDGVQFSKMRKCLMVELLRTFEYKELKQLADYVIPKEERLCEDPEQLIRNLLHYHWDPCDIFTRRKNDKTLKELKPGDLISFVEKSWNHWGVYIGKENDVRSFIHWTADDYDIEPSRMSDDSNDCKPRIEISPVTKLREAEKLEKHNSDNLENKIIDGAQVVEKIKAFKALIEAGEENRMDYSILFRDCEQFAKWCRYGLGLKHRQMSTEDINKIKDVRMFVQGEFSNLPWRVRPNEHIHMLRMLQLRKSKAEIGKDSEQVKGSRDIAEPHALLKSMLNIIAPWFLDSLFFEGLSYEFFLWRSLLFLWKYFIPVGNVAAARRTQSVRSIRPSL